MTLSTYLADSRRILHDPNGDNFSDATLTSFINEAIQKRDRMTLCNRQLQSFTLTIGTDGPYPFSGLTNTRVFDVIGINVIVSGMRFVLSRRSFTMLNVRVRQLSPSWRDVPTVYAVYGAASPGVYFAPSPSIAYVTEWDTAVYSAALAAGTDDDGISYPFTEPVKYYVASLAELNGQRFEASDMYMDKFEKACLGTTQATRGILANPYAGR